MMRCSSQALQKEAREAHDTEVRQVSAEREALEVQSKAQQVQCQQQLADLEALRQELAAAHEGRKAANAKIQASCHTSEDTACTLWHTGLVEMDGHSTQRLLRVRSSDNDRQALVCMSSSHLQPWAFSS